jgi:diguanylate cyclase (GGDEF)-like protein
MYTKDQEFFTSHNKDHVFDTLTGCVNKDYFFKYAEYLIEQTNIFTMYYVDVDNLRKINSLYGRSTGDQVLKDITKAIEEVIQQKGVLFRYEGDIFTIITPNIATYEDVWNLSRDICEKIRHLELDYLNRNSEEYHLTLTMGISRYPIDSLDMDMLLSNSEKALYRGKMKGRNCFIIYNKNLHGEIDVTKKKSSLGTNGLIDYMFEMFKIHDPMEAMTMVCHMVGNYYSVRDIYHISRDGCQLMYCDPSYTNKEPLSLHYSNFPFPKGESHIIGYRSILKSDKTEDTRRMAFMDKRSIHSFIAFDIGASEEVLLIESENERIWSDTEILLYSTMGHIYCLVKELHK